MSSIVVLKSGTVRDSEVGKGREHPMALTEVQRAHDAAWNFTMVDGGGLHPNGYKLSEEVRRSAEFSAGKRRSSPKEDYYGYSSVKEEKENVDVHTAKGDVGEESKVKESRGDAETDAEKMKLDEHCLRNRVWALEEDKGKLHKDLAAMTLKETILRDKVRE